MDKIILKRILLIENDVDNAHVVKLTLEKKGGYTVHYCLSVEKALEEAPAFEPQLILLDVMMPHVSGPDTLKLLKKAPVLAKVPVVFITAKCRSLEIEEYKKMGVFHVIRKPFDVMKLSNIVQNIWESL